MMCTHAYIPTQAELSSGGADFVFDSPANMRENLPASPASDVAASPCTGNSGPAGLGKVDRVLPANCDPDSVRANARGVAVEGDTMSCLLTDATRAPSSQHMQPTAAPVTADARSELQWRWLQLAFPDQNLLSARLGVTGMSPAEKINYQCNLYRWPRSHSSIKVPIPGAVLEEAGDVQSYIPLGEVSYNGNSQEISD